MSPKSSFLLKASRILILAGVVSVPIGLLNLVYPPSIESTVWGYPYHPGTHVVVSIVLVIAHLLKAYGFVGLSRLNGATRVVRWSLMVAALGFVVVAVCEGISATLVGVPIDSPAARAPPRSRPARPIRGPDPARSSASFPGEPARPRCG